jgi:hypothetical protein
MNRLVCSFVFAIAFVVLGSSASPVLAQSPWLYGGMGGGFYGPYWQSTTSPRTPPYYAVHPPVYYSSEVIRRPYGTSPFALFDTGYNYGAAHQRAAVAQAAPVQPLLVVNSHYAATAGTSNVAPSLEITPVSQNESSQQAQRPQGILILNPHVRQKDRVASTDR